jgi:hypothetical protein
MQMHDIIVKDDVNVGLDYAIAELIEALGKRLEAIPDAQYHEVYRAVRKFVEWYKTAEADLKQYKVEIERRRQIGLTIDPATAETTFGWRDVNDPYGIRDQRYHLDCAGREEFARNPDGEWVHFHDLPEATRDAVREHAPDVDDSSLFKALLGRPKS